MNELSPEVRALLDQAGAQHDPDARDVERNLAALHGGLAFSGPALGSAAGLEPAVAETPAAAFSGGALVSAKGVKLYLVVAALVGGAGTAAVWRATPRPPTAARPAPVQAPRVEHVEQAVPVEPEPPAVVAQPPRVKPAFSASAELSLIESVNTSLSRGDAGAALRLLAEHARRHPRGQLRIEREGLRAIALCTGGQAQAGSAAREQFLKRHASAPIASRVRTACP
jgi:hypothetical protein